ncbi:MAG: phosphoenolpyruvate carboxykinase (ATP) [Candidatus Mcinerneyibacterium aminivorans]|uniref:Phosphoenolpyruvate carboxykinase (ATP) n=1 Tax=Candidatus Mcinerneyibacterium aminivorans TaxID=2703815 RepID=A0A5D0MJ25_9BACT|nr:MAG: phosphoenolpyruvate carboxykinase (ATP) [Candidatus Mcinerneyibacterium aminivorans]
MGILDGKIKKFLKEKNGDIQINPKRETVIADAVRKNEAMVAKNGSLATWTPVESTGRSPKDTVIVKRQENEDKIDWSSPNNIPVDEETFDMAFNDAIELLKEETEITVTDRVVGADSSYALPVRTITDFSLSALLTYNMFRPVPDDIENSIFKNREFTVLVLPYKKLERKKYKNRLRKLENGKTSNMIVAMDFERRKGVIIGSAYMGSLKKMIFTVMNYYLPFENILPLHCSANEGEEGDSALLLGLSGTGKTTLSADPSRSLLGDDEHGWSENGIANFENGCYAKLIDLDKEKEPEIFNAVMHNDNYLEHGVIVENAMIYPNGEYDFYDDRLTPNSRASYPLRYLRNIKESSKSTHPDTILFLTADAYGVLPPVSKLTKNQAMLWFLMGYTSKLAGTETGIDTPVAVFSRFFGQPFMPAKPSRYAEMLGEKINKYDTSVYLINTGWIGGSYGTGHRINLKYTRAMVNAALEAKLEQVEYEMDKRFHLKIPKSCPNVPAEILNQKNTWDNKKAYEKKAEELANEFSSYFDKAYGNQNIDRKIEKECPGK